MEIALARTFLEIVGSGSFIRAAERLHVTQTAVSVRVRKLESLLGRKLFERSKSGAALTAAGEEFLRFAPSLVQLWERARHQVAVPHGRRAVIAVAGELSLWDPLLLEWMVWMRRSVPELAVRARVALPQQLMDQVGAGIVDIGVLYTPQQRPGLKVELLMKEKLLLVTTRGKAVRGGDYIYVDWGPEFATQHNLTYPELSSPGTYVDLGPLGLQYILRAGGSGYFRQHAAAPYLRTGKLKLVRGAPEFLYPAYAVYAEDADPKLLMPALTGLRHVAKQPQDSGHLRGLIARAAAAGKSPAPPRLARS
ncbi:MAG: LysR family transcriptional regulator [Burkholderiales bacterium]